MLSQEEYVNEVLALKPQGLTMVEIAGDFGYHPATISKWLASGGPPERASSRRRRWWTSGGAARIAELLARSPRLFGDQRVRDDRG